MLEHMQEAVRITCILVRRFPLTRTQMATVQMGIVTSTEDELLSDIDRLRSERDLAREEVVRMREEREAAMYSAISEARLDLIDLHFL